MLMLLLLLLSWVESAWMGLGLHVKTVERGSILVASMLGLLLGASIGLLSFLDDAEEEDDDTVAGAGSKGPRANISRINATTAEQCSDQSDASAAAI